MEVLAVMEDASIEVAQFEHCQGTHGEEIGREFRRLKEDPWTEDTKAAIVECVEHCEDEKLTAKQIKDHAKQIVRGMLEVRDGTPSQLPIPRVKPGECKRPRMNVHSRDVTVLTVSFGDQAPPSDNQVVCQSSFVIVSDGPVPGGLWDTEVIGGDARTALYVKTHPHLFVKTPYSVWVSPGVSLRIPPIEMVEKHLDGYDLALMKHPNRDCVYEAARSAIAAGLDKPQVIRRQMATYRGQRFPPHYGFSDTTVLVCRHTPGLLRFLAAWWEAIRRGSVCDQLSFDYCRRKLAFPVNHLTAGDFDPPQVSPPAVCFAPQGSECMAPVAVS